MCVFYVCAISFIFPFSISFYPFYSHTSLYMHRFFVHVKVVEKRLCACMPTTYVCDTSMSVLCFHIATWHAMRIHWVLTETSDTLAEYNSIQTKIKPNKHSAHVVCMRFVCIWTYPFIRPFDTGLLHLRTFCSHLTCSIRFVSFHIIYLQKHHSEKKTYNKKNSSTRLHHDRPKTTCQSRHDGTFKTRNKIHSHIMRNSHMVTDCFFHSPHSHIHFTENVCVNRQWSIHFKMDEIHYTEWLSFNSSVFLAFLGGYVLKVRVVPSGYHRNKIIL